MWVKKKRVWWILIGWLLLVLSVQAETLAPSAINDPENLPPPPVITETAPAPGSFLDSYNHAVYNFNDIMDRIFLKPVAKLYNKIIPKPLHRGISNFFSNIDNVPTVLNDVLQLQFYHTMSDSWRLLVNSTVGIGGLFDVASRIGLKPHHEDFGLTLARWGYTSSNFFMVPFFGAGTIRDVIGWPVDYFFFSVYPYIGDPWVRYAVYGVGVVDRRANVLQYQEVLDQVAVDKYAFYRTAYMQNRQYQIKQNDKRGHGSQDLEDDSVQN